MHCWIPLAECKKKAIVQDHSPPFVSNYFINNNLRKLLCMLLLFETPSKKQKSYHECDFDANPTLACQ